MTELERIRSVVDWLKNAGAAKTVFGVGQLIGYTNKSSFSQALNNADKQPKDFVERLCSLNSSLNYNWVKTGEGEMLRSEYNQQELQDNLSIEELIERLRNGVPIIKYRSNESIKADELKQKEYRSFVEVRVVSTKARAGYSESYYSDEYLEDMPTIPIECDKEYKGKYLAFEVDGDSMEPDYHKGDTVICREVKREYWRSKLHIKEYDFVIAHSTQGIMLKQIIDHNVETGEIVCHSVNTEEHPDFTLNLREVAFLFNVVEHRISGKNKRRYR